MESGPNCNSISHMFEDWLVGVDSKLKSFFFSYVFFTPTIQRGLVCRPEGLNCPCRYLALCNNTNDLVFDNSPIN